MTLIRWNLSLLACAALLLGALPVASFAADLKPSMEPNVSRWGSDYKRFALDKGGAEACSEACAGDAKCLAWSYVKPGVSGPAAVCRLKSTVPSAASDTCCVSGVMASNSSNATTGSVSAGKTSQMALVTKPVATGVTGSVGKKKKKLPIVTTTAMPAGEVLQMPMEAETPEALTSVTVPLDMPSPVSGN